MGRGPWTWINMDRRGTWNVGRGHGLDLLTASASAVVDFARELRNTVYIFLPRKYLLATHYGPAYRAHSVLTLHPLPHLLLLFIMGTCVVYVCIMEHYTYVSVLTILRCYI